MTPYEIRAHLLSLAEEEYRSFMLPLLPTVTPERVIGVRTPLLRKLARDLRRDGSALSFMADLPHLYQEENMLHGILLAEMREADALYPALEVFLPFVDNWAVCDSLRPRVLAHDKSRLLCAVRAWLASPYPYTVRFGIEMLMCFFLEEDFSPDLLALVADVSREEYYIKMMQAWFFAEALVRQFGATFPCFSKKRLSPWVHRKAVSKACDSHRLSLARKQACRDTLSTKKEAP